MALTSRLRRLEQGLGTRTCPECRGEPPWVVSYMREGDPEPVPMEGGCPACGAINHILVRYTLSPIGFCNNMSAEEIGAFYA